MRLTALTAIGALAFSLAGCATLPASKMSYADPKISPAATQYVAKDIAKRTARIVPPAKTTLVVAPTPQSQAELSNVVNEAFRKRGYAVTELMAPVPGKPAVPQKGVPLRYQITADTGLVLARVEVSRRMLARAYSVSDDKTTLHASGPWSSMELPQ